MTDEEYIERRNELIPQAAAVADEVCAGMNRPIWTRRFLFEMDVLAYHTGLTSWLPKTPPSQRIEVIR